jgi:acetylornithine/N-succinyldiaminopimelate aminotransferase
MMRSADDSPLLAVYNRADLVMRRGEGVYLFDEEGRRYLDFAAGIAVNALGHCHPHLVAELRAQAGELWHCSNLYHTASLTRFAERLTQASFADKVFFTNSGSEAVECGIKMVRRYHHAKGRPRPRIVTVTGAFHGRTLACISTGQQKRATAGFGPLLDGFDIVPFNDVAALEAAIGPETGGILFETIQGEGGIFEATRAFAQAARALCDARDLLLFLDEVQCGMGRSGSLFAFEQLGVIPDLCSAAKGIGGGFPLGACLANARAASGMTKGSHGGTYGGNPLAMSAGNAVLDCLLAPGFMENVMRAGDYFAASLDEIKYEFPHLFDERRGRGLMLGLHMKIAPQGLTALAQAKGLLLASASGDDVIRFLPPLIVTQAQIDEGMALFRQACRQFCHECGA